MPEWTEFELVAMVIGRHFFQCDDDKEAIRLGTEVAEKIQKRFREAGYDELCV